jgi:hypothetical protein
MQSSARDLVKRIQEKAGRSSATILVTPTSRDRYFIGEALFAAVALFLLNRFATGFVKGLGVDDAGERLGVWVRDEASPFLRDLEVELVTGKASKAMIERGHTLLDEVLADLRRAPRKQGAVDQAKVELAECLKAKGAISEQAEDIASEVADVLLGGR